MRCYIAGPMSGYPEFNHPAFHDVEQQLWQAGIRAVSPHRAPKQPTPEAYICATT